MSYSEEWKETEDFSLKNTINKLHNSKLEFSSWKATILAIIFPKNIPI